MILLSALSQEYTCTEASHTPNEAASTCRVTPPRCNLLQNEKCQRVDASYGMLTADPTCVALASASAHFDGPTADSSGRAVYEANRGCSHTPKLVVILAHRVALRLLCSMRGLPRHKCMPGFTPGQSV